MEQENWRRDPDWIATMGKLGPEIQWYTCDCGAHWLGLHCGPECVHSHRQYLDWNLCNWPPEMLKYWDIHNWRARTPPVDYPQLPVGYDDFLTRMLEGCRKRWPVTRLVNIDHEKKIAYFDTPVASPLRITDNIWYREYESKFNYRAWTPPVGYPDITPPRRMHHVVFKDIDTGTVWFEAIMPGERVAEFRNLLWKEACKGATWKETP